MSSMQKVIMDANTINEILIHLLILIQALIIINETKGEYK